MGGNIFLTAVADGHPTLRTARLSQTTYNKLKTVVVQRLSAQLTNAKIIKVPHEAPEKLDHGDIDIIIADDGIIDWDIVATSVGAVAWVNRGSESHAMCSLAMRLDGKRSEEAAVKYVKTNANDPLHRTPSQGFAEGSFAQVDLEQISPALQDWYAFYSSYGDLAGILGFVVTNFGFDVTSYGLRLRLEELDQSTEPGWEHFNPPRDKGRMVLSTDPARVMEFFGLSAERYNSGFDSTEELFRWVSECKMVCEYSLKRERHIPVSREERTESRSMFHTFSKVWLPDFLNGKKPAGKAIMSDDDNDDEEAHVEKPSISEFRQRYLNDALDFFEKRSQYITLHSALLRRRDIDTAEARLRPLIVKYSNKKGPGLAELARAFRRNVARRNGQLIILEEAKSDAESQLPTLLDESGKELYDPQGVDAWVKDHYEEVKAIERDRSKKRKLGQ